MKAYLSAKKYIKNNELFLFRYIPACFGLFLCGFMLLKFPDTAHRGISDGIDICFRTLIPYLFPFMVLSNFFVSFGLCGLFDKMLSPVTKLFFALPGKCGSVILLSLIGGFPVGGKMTQSLYEKGIISRSQGQRLMLFCVNPGPAFVVSTVGFYMLGSKKVGILLFISLTLSSLITGVISRFFFEEDNQYCDAFLSATDDSFYSALVKSVNAAAQSMLSVCAFVTVFSCVAELLELSSLSGDGKLFLFSILEVTKGCIYAAGNVPVSVIAGILAFGGISTHCQIMSGIMSLKMKLKHFLVGRVIASSLAIIISNVLFTLFPISLETISFGNRPAGIYEASLSVSLCMVLSCVLFLLGDKTSIKIKNLSARER